MLRIACLISGTGSNLKRLIEHISQNNLSDKANIELVISNNENAPGLNHARQNNIKNLVISYDKPGKNKGITKEQKRKLRTSCDQKLFDALVENCINIVYCLGWMMILGSGFIDNCEKVGIKLINLHPSLPGDEKLIGTNCIERAYQLYLAGERLNTGVMMHHVIADVDKGKPIYWDSLDMSTCKDKEDYIKKIDVIEKNVVIMAFNKIINDMDT